MYKIGILIFICSFSFFTSGAWAGPYGLEMGMSLEDLNGNPEKIGPDKYVIYTVPEPVSQVESYAVRISPKGGLFWIKAVGKTMSTNPDGSEVRKAFEKVQQETAAVYGNSRSYDFLVDGSTLDQPDDWMQGIINWERVLGALWKKSEWKSLPDSLEEVFVGAEAVSSTQGFISIEYTFSNMNTCEAELFGMEKKPF